MTTKNKLEMIAELIDCLLIEAIQTDLKLKQLDKSIDPNSYSATVHLAKTIKEILNETE